MARKLLLVDDEPLIIKGLRFSLEQEGYEVDSAADGEEAMAKFGAGAFDLVLLDVMLPNGMDGYNICAVIRGGGSDVPVIFVTALDDLDSKRRGYGEKCNDYIAKPYSVQELLLKARACIESHKGLLNPQQALCYGPIELRLTENTAYVSGQAVKLTPKELAMLKVFLERPNRMLGRNELLNLVWGYDFYADSRVVDTTVSKLRQKLGEERDMIQGVYGAGYRLKKEDSA